ncbi:MAG: type II secretion system protein, partial [Planctomycetota bacterium]
MIQPAPRVRAFTIIELLVTISIVAVLIALLTPAIVSASSKAEEVKCLANIRSIGQATIAYTADHDRKFPVGLGNDLNLLNLV